MDREKVIKGLEDIQKHLDTKYSFAIRWDSKLILNAIALLKEQEHRDKMFHALEDDWKRLNELLKEQDRQNWRLCSEELPETDDEVLITYTVFGNKKKRFVETASYCDDVEGEGHWNSVWDEYRIAGAEKEVIAWMPLPKPYREGR